MDKPLGGLAAREVGRRGRERGLRLHYPLLGAAGYTGLLVWHGGLSGSAPLAVATPGHFLVGELRAMGWPDGLVPFTATVLSTRNLVATAGAVLLAVGLCVLMVPKRPEDRIAPPDPLPGGDPREELPGGEETGPATFAGRLDGSRLLVLPIALAGLGYSAWLLVRRGGQPDLGILNLSFLSAGLLLHGTARAYSRAVAEAVRGIAGIVLQFPFYAGILGMMRYSGGEAGPSLVEVLAHAATSVAGPETLPALGFLSAAVVNLFVPSGGGQWAVQGPMLLEAGRDLGTGAGDLVLALSWGDQLTNMLQPFWALPLLALTGLRARDILGYTAVLMLFVGAWFLAVLLI